MLHDVRQHQIIEIAGLNFVAGAGIFPQTVIGLANVIRLVNRFPYLSGKAVLSRPAYFLITYLHGFPSSGTVDKAVEQVIERTAIPLHDRRTAVDQLLHPVPLVTADNGFMAVFNDLPLVTRDKIHRVGANGLLVRLTNYMIALVDWISQHFVNRGAAP